MSIMSEKTRGSWLPFHQRKNQKKDCEANIRRCRWPDCILPHKCSNWKTVECYFIQAAHCKHICISLRVNKLYICLWSANSSNHSHIISSFQFFFLSISLVFYFSVFLTSLGKILYFSELGYPILYTSFLVKWSVIYYIEEIKSEKGDHFLHAKSFRAFSLTSRLVWCRNTEGFFLNFHPRHHFCLSLHGDSTRSA